MREKGGREAVRDEREKGYEERGRGDGERRGIKTEEKRRGDR